MAKSKDQWRTITTIFQITLVARGNLKRAGDLAGARVGSVRCRRDKRRGTQRATYILICPWSFLHTVWLAPFWQQILKFCHGLPCLMVIGKKQHVIWGTSSSKVWHFLFCRIQGHGSCMHCVNTSTLEKAVKTSQHTFLRNCLANISFFQQRADSSSYSSCTSSCLKHNWQPERYVPFNYGLKLQNVIFSLGYIK